MTESHDHFDYVIVGAGSAGCVLANRLSADPHVRVLLLEAGGWDRDPWLSIPLGWPHVFLNQLHDWGYEAEPEQAVAGRAIEFARGRVVGGSSSTNAMAYVRGHRADYDRWAALGLDRWSFDEVLPYFRRQERWEDGEDQYRGSGGPLSTQRCRFVDPIIEAYVAAANEAGYANTPDYNGAQQEGFARWQMTIRNGRRCSAAVAFLRPALKRPNLKVVTRARATKIMIERGRARGLAYARRGRSRTVFATREVIIAGGVINSPQLLLLSGLGDEVELAKHGIATVVHRPGVGRNLQDHMSVAVAYGRRGAGPLHETMRIDRLVRELAKAYVLGKGVASDLPAGVMAFLRTRADEVIPDLQLMFNAAPFAARPYLKPFVQPYEDGFAARVVVLRPESRGTVELRSADPLAAPIIRQNFFASAKDLRTLCDGVAIARTIAAQPALQSFLDREKLPGPNLRSPSEIERYVRETAITVHHPAGTCRMGLANDTHAVVDGELKVFGIDGLRVVDASVMPDLVGGNINAPVMMIADRAADFILADASPGRARAQDTRPLSLEASVQ